jgi:hypothetical protein
MNATYNPTRPVLRTVFVAIALVVTLSLGAGIEGLAQHYAANAVTPATTMLASAR